MEELTPTMEQTAYLGASPEILVGLIKKIEAASSVYPSKFNRGPVQLYRVKTHVENVLKGNIGEEDIDIYCFLRVGNIGGLPSMPLIPGETDIFYLPRAENKWRTACDFYDYCVDVVLTGSHTHFRRNMNRPVSDAILQILLTRDGGASDGQMVDILAGRIRFGYGRWTYKSDQYVKLLQNTAQTETPPVSAEACEQLRISGKACTPCEANRGPKASESALVPASKTPPSTSSEPKPDLKTVDQKAKLLIEDYRTRAKAASNTRLRHPALTVTAGPKKVSPTSSTAYKPFSNSDEHPKSKLIHERTFLQCQILP